MERKTNIQIQLFLTFLKIGAFTFGGGYAMIPLIQKEVVENKRWLCEKDIADVIAIAESTPGPIAINAATFVGYKTAGFWGAFCATVGVVIPSFLIILLVASMLYRYMELPVAQNAFWGIRIAVLALMTKALLSMFRQCPKHIFSYLVAVIAFPLVAFLKVSAIWIILSAALLGIACQELTERRQK